MSELDAGTGLDFIPVGSGVDSPANGLRQSGPVDPGGRVYDDNRAWGVALYRYRARFISGFFGVAGYITTAAVIISQIWGR